MSGARAGLLHRAVCYALDAVDAVTPAMLARPTPCRGWDLRMLLRHGCESSTALHEGLDAGRIGLHAAADDEDAATDPTGVFRVRAGRLRDRWTTDDARLVAIADWPLGGGVMAAAGALELAVHGWDVFQASGLRRPIPPDLAADLLAVARSLVPVTNRRPLFAPPVPVGPAAGPGDRLVAYLGRTAAGGGRDGAPTAPCPDGGRARERCPTGPVSTDPARYAHTPATARVGGTGQRGSRA